MSSRVDTSRTRSSKSSEGSRDSSRANEATAQQKLRAAVVQLAKAIERSDEMQASKIRQIRTSQNSFTPAAGSVVSKSAQHLEEQAAVIMLTPLSK